VVEHDWGRAGQWTGQDWQPIVGDRARGARGLEGRAHRVVASQAQSALLLGGEGRRRRHGATAMVSRDAGASPAAIDRSEVRADPGQGSRL
jgi:hypothetical protein